MRNYSQMTALELNQSLMELNAQLEKVAPELTAEIRLVKVLIESKGNDQSAFSYASCRTPQDAIELALKLNGDFKLTKAELVTQIVEGGYLTKTPKGSRGLINSSFNHHLKSGNLIEKNGKVGFPKKKA